MHLISVVNSDGGVKTATNVSLSPGANAERATSLSAANATPVGWGASATVRSARRVRSLVNFKLDTMSNERSEVFVLKC